jgi:uncharacterized protein (TIGR03435 family)
MKSVYWSSKLFSALTATALAFVIPGPPRASAQVASTPTIPLAFDVATVKPDDPNKMNMVELRVYPGGRLLIHSYTLRSLIAAAFDLSYFQLVGGQSWLGTLHFDVEGKPPAELRNSLFAGEYSNSGIQDPQVRSMLQALLIDRFRLKFHIERQPGTVYLLERSNGPLRLKKAELSLYKRADDGSVTPTDAYPTGDMGMASGSPVMISQTSMAQLANLLGTLQHAPVIDQTGLPGFYNFRSQTIVTDEDFKAGGPMHLFIDALPEMGLKLVKTQGTVEKFVVDNAESPTPD